MADKAKTDKKTRELIGDAFAEEAARLQAEAGDGEVAARVEIGPEGTNIESARQIPMDRLLEFENVREVSHHIDELAASMREQGLLQPIVVRPSPEEPDFFEIVCGHRRSEAARLLGWASIAALVQEGKDDIACVEMALVENIERESLSADEIGRAIRRLIDMSDNQLSQLEVAKRLGKDPSFVSYALRLAEMPMEIQNLVAEEKLTMGHIKALVRIPEERQIAMAKKAASREVGVREFSEWVASDLSSEIAPQVVDEFEVREYALAATPVEVPQYGEFPVEATWRFVLYGAMKGFNDYRWMLPRGAHYTRCWQYIESLTDEEVQEALLDLGRRYVTNPLAHFALEHPLSGFLNGFEEAPDSAISDAVIEHAARLDATEFATAEETEETL